jgi:hypothetical protein
MEFSSFNAVESQNAVFFPFHLRTMACHVFLGLLPFTLLSFGLVQVSSVVVQPQESRLSFA